MVTDTIGPSVLLGGGALANLMFLLCLRHTWKLWKPARWYLLMLAVGNTMEVLFTLTTQLGDKMTSHWPGEDVSCKILMCLAHLGPSLANMALATLALHVLLTAMTGCHGNAVRHVLVIGLFVLLALPLPASKILMYGVVEDGDKENHRLCTDLAFFQDQHTRVRFYFFVASSIALVFFPLVIIAGAVGGAAMFLCVDSRGQVKTDSNSAEVTLSAALGCILLLFGVPLYAYVFYQHGQMLYGPQTSNIYVILLYLFNSRVTATAIVSVLFAYAHVYRKGRGSNPRLTAAERRKLVN